MDLTLRLDRGIPDVPWARHELISAMKQDHVTADTDQVGLVVTELLTNALLHGKEPVQVHAAVVGDHLRVEVRDAGEARPRPRRAEPTATTGRGLMLVAGLVERWGVDQSGDGKCVWAEFEAPPGSSHGDGGARRARGDIRLPDTSPTVSAR